MSQKLISTLISIIVICKLSQEIEATNKQSINETYSKCNLTNSVICLGMPTGCVPKKTCDILLTATPLQNSTNFKMFWNRDSEGQDRWVGAALSEDRKMGNDSVTECILERNNTVIVRQGLTISDGVKTVEPVKGILKEVGNFSDSIVSCSWSRADDTMVTNIDFNIINKKYYVLLAYGSVGAKDELKSLSYKWISKDAVYFGPKISNITTSTRYTSPVNATLPPKSTPGGSTYISFSLSLAIFVTIVLSLNL